MARGTIQDKETIICAAIWYKDFDKAYHSVDGIDRGTVVGGYRHGYIIGTMLSITGKKNHELGETVHGFITSKGRFVDRREAAELAMENGQCVPEFGDELYSEDLY